MSNITCSMLTMSDACSTLCLIHIFLLFLPNNLHPDPYFPPWRQRDKNRYNLLPTFDNFAFDELEIVF